MAIPLPPVGAPTVGFEQQLLDERVKLKVLDLSPKTRDCLLVDSIAILVDKYLAILGMNVPAPRICLADTLGPKWFGLCSWNRGDAFTTITIQRAATADHRSMARIVAHETIHHALFLTVGNHDHGGQFMVLARKINAVEGANFVTTKCGNDYVMGGRTTRDYWLLVVPHPSLQGSFLYAWCGKVTPQARRVAESRGGKLVRVGDHSWSIFGQRFTKRSAGKWSVPQGERAAKLAKLFAEAE